MCYNNGKMYYDKVRDKDMFILHKLIEKTNTSYIYETKNGMKLEIRLRFKNGCGLCYPAFQIKRKINIKDLKKKCCENNLKPPRLKKDIQKP